MSSEDGPNPYAAPQVGADQVLQPRIQVAPRAVRAWVIAECVVLAVALLAQWIDIESIVFSGPVFCLVGLGTVVASFRGRRPLGVVFGSGAVAFSVFIFLLIYFNHWSPSEARRPVIGLTWCYVALMSPLIGVLVKDGKPDVGTVEN